MVYFNNKLIKNFIVNFTIYINKKKYTQILLLIFDIPILTQLMFIGNILIIPIIVLFEKQLFLISNITY